MSFGASTDDPSAALSELRDRITNMRTQIATLQEQAMAMETEFYYGSYRPKTVDSASKGTTLQDGDTTVKRITLTSRTLEPAATAPTRNIQTGCADG